MMDAAPEFLAPFQAAGGPTPEQGFYFGESVLLPKYRGEGIGHRFGRRPGHGEAAAVLGARRHRERCVKM